MDEEKRPPESENAPPPAQDEPTANSAAPTPIDTEVTPENGAESPDAAPAERMEEAPADELPPDDAAPAQDAEGEKAVPESDATEAGSDAAENEDTPEVDTAEGDAADADAPSPEDAQKKQRRRRMRRVRWVGFGLAVLCFILCGAQVLRYQLAAQQTQEQVAQLKQLRGEQVDGEEPLPEDAGPDLAALQALNADFVAWLSVEGTRIDYPVMQSGENNPERYLRRDFYGDYDINGTPFLDARCALDPASDNLVIYGHNMSSGIMFHDLLSYKEYSFWEEYPYITLETFTGVHTYQIFSVYLFDALGDPDAFLPHREVNYTTEEEFDAFLAETMGRSYYDTAVEVAYGDKLLTLATCDKRVLRQGRMIVVARLVTEVPPPWISELPDWPLGGEPEGEAEPQEQPEPQAEPQEQTAPPQVLPEFQALPPWFTRLMLWPMVPPDAMQDPAN